MNSLAASMVELSRLSSEIDRETRGNRQAIKKLSTTKENLQRVWLISCCMFYPPLAQLSVITALKNTRAYCKRGVVCGRGCLLQNKGVL